MCKLLFSFLVALNLGFGLCDAVGALGPIGQSGRGQASERVVAEGDEYEDAQSSIKEKGSVGSSIRGAKRASSEKTASNSQATPFSAVLERFKRALSEKQAPDDVRRSLEVKVIKTKAKTKRRPTHDTQSWVNPYPDEDKRIDSTTTTTTTTSTTTCPTVDIIPGGDCSAYAAGIECATGYSCSGVAEGRCICDGGTSQWSSCSVAAAVECSADVVDVECADDNSVHLVSRDPLAACGPCNHICKDGSVATEKATTTTTTTMTATTTTTVTPSTAARVSSCPAVEISHGSDCSAYAPELECASGYSCSGVQKGTCSCDAATTQWSCTTISPLFCIADTVDVQCAGDNYTIPVGRDEYATCGPCNHYCKDGSIATEVVKGESTSPPLNGPTTITPSTAARFAATECPATMPNRGDACSSSAISKCNYNPACCCENDPALFEYSYDCSNDAFGPPAIMGLRCAECAKGVNAGGPCDNGAGCSGTMKHNNTVCEENLEKLVM